MERLFNALGSKPALKIAAPFIIGLMLGNHIEAPPIALFLALIITTMLAVLCLRSRIHIGNFLLALGLITAGMLRFGIATQLMPANHIKYFAGTKEKITILCRVSGYPQIRENGIQVEIQIDSLIIDSSIYPVYGNALLKIINFDHQFHYGDRLKIHSKLRQPDGERNPGGFDYRKFLNSQNIFALVTVLKPTDLILLERTAPSTVAGIFFQIKSSLDQKINSLFDKQQRALIRALLLGERGEISSKLREAFARSGVIHALAISGLHVGYILIILAGVFSILPIPRKIKIVLIIAGLLFYNLLVGFKPPIVRASLMASLFLLGKLLQKPVDILNIISVSALIILLIDPQQLFLASFQLSFAAILSIIFIYQKLKIVFEKSQRFRKLTQSKIGEYTGALFLVSLSAQLGTLPIVVYYFHRIPLIALLANLLVIPIVGLVIAYGFICLIVSLIAAPVAQLFANTAGFLVSTLIVFLRNTGSWWFAAVDVYSVTLTGIVIYYFFLYLSINLDKKSHQKLGILTILVLANIFIWRSNFAQRDWLQITFFDVGQGDACLIQFPDGKNLLIDAGPNLMNFDAGEYFIVPGLKRYGIKKLDAAILSHADNDHIGGLPSVMRKIAVEKIYDAGLYHSTAICSLYQFLIDSLKLNYQKIDQPIRLDEFSRCGVYAIHPRESGLKMLARDVNNNSVVIKIIYNQVSFLFTGDIEKKAETYIQEYRDLLRSDVIKVAHHGSKTSSTKSFIEQVKPELAVISVGKNNRFNFPDATVLSRFENFKIRVLRTDLNGAIILRTDGKTLQRIR